MKKTMKIRIEPTKFINTKTGHESFGVRVHDSHESAFFECGIIPPPEDDMALIRWCASLPNAQIQDIFHFLGMRKGDVEIGDATYKWQTIKHLLEHIEMEVQHEPSLMC